MAILKKRVLQLATCCAVATSWLCFASPASAALIRDFESSTPPAGDQYIPNQVGPPLSPGAVWAPGGSPGSTKGQMSNTNAPGYGNTNSLSQMYNGVYRINGDNLINELGTNSLSAFTLTYAYKPGGQSPDVNLSTNNRDTRQFRLWEFNTGVTKLDVIMTGGTSSVPGTRPSLRLNGSSVATNQAANANFSRRLMDGDPNTYVNPNNNNGGGDASFNAANSEWVFYAVTYSVVNETTVQVDEYGMTLFGSGVTQNSNGLRKYTSTETINLPANSNIITLTPNTRLDLGSAAFGGNGNRPYDGYFDMLKMYPNVLTVDQLQQLATRAFVAPEPSSALLLVGMLLGIASASHRGRAV